MFNKIINVVGNSHYVDPDFFGDLRPADRAAFSEEFEDVDVTSFFLGEIVALEIYGVH